MNPETVNQISECFIKPHHLLDEAKQPIYLGPWDLAMLSVHYIQKGLLFKKPLLSNNQENPIETLIENLKESLSATLVHFYPLAGRLTTLKQENPQIYSVYNDCNNSPGARFVQASVNLKISDILSPTDVPLVVQSFFDHDRAINHDGHTMSLLTLQLTELIDGIFIGCSVNHSVADGSSYWNFFNTLSEVFKAKVAGQNISTLNISRPPIHKRWLPDGYGPIISLPFNDSNQFISRFNAPLFRERIFHFSAVALARVKARANAGCSGTTAISTLQALSALLWRCVTRIRCVPHDGITKCTMMINNRSRLYPPLSQNYFGSVVQSVGGMTTAGELLAHELGWAARLLNQAVVGHDDKAVRDYVESWLQSPTVSQLGQLYHPYSIRVGTTSRFDMYGNEFGLGKAVAIRSGRAAKFDGKLTLYPGQEGGGSMDLEMCLSPDSMRSVECDEEFLDALTFSNQMH